MPSRLDTVFERGGHLVLDVVENRLPIGKLAAISLTALGLLDWATGYELTFEALYLIPIGIAGLSYGWTVAGPIALMVVAFDLVHGLVQGYEFSSSFYFYFNVFSKLLSYSAFLTVVELLRRAILLQVQLSERDNLTGLLNRAALNKVLDAELLRLKRDSHGLGILFIDCDNFKEVNDRCGHAIGDALLGVVSQTLRNNLREVDCVARYGGDEFVVLLPHSTDQATVLFVAEKLRKELLSRMAHEQWPITFSIGIHTVRDAGTTSAESALHQADMAMYSAKREGKNRIAAFGGSPDSVAASIR